MRVETRYNRKTGQSYQTKVLTFQEMKMCVQTQLKANLSLNFEGCQEFDRTGKVSPKNVKGRLTAKKRAKLQMALNRGRGKKQPMQTKQKIFEQGLLTYTPKQKVHYEDFSRFDDDFCVDDFLF